MAIRVTTSRDLAIDIETRPDPAIVSNVEYWAQVAENLIPPKNYKDQAKILEWRTDRVSELRAQCALRPWHGVVVAAAIKDLDDDDFIAQVCNLEDEHMVLQWILRHVPPDARLIGWNLRSFDIPFLLGRIAIRQLGPVGIPMPRDYRRVLDLYEVLDGKLADWMPAVGIKPIEGDVLELDAETLAAKNRQDVKAVARLALPLRDCFN